MLVAITGTPGTGKNSIGEVLSRRGYAVVDLDHVARTERLVVGRDEARGSDEIDVRALRQRLRTSAKVAFLKGHYSHLMDVNLAIVLRCKPSELRNRLISRGWPPEKVRENLEAEALDVITQEAVARIDRVFEVDTTNLLPEEAAERVLAILRGKTEGHEPGRIDWSEEVLTWS